MPEVDKSRAQVYSSREKYGKELARIGEIDDRIVILNADCMRSTRAIDFAERFPERNFGVGIAEQDMMGIAAGMALEGKIPFVTTFATFCSMRPLEQVRTDICYPHLPVRIVSTHAGLSSNCGPTHYSQEDIGLMRNLIGLTIISPGDSNQIGKILDATLNFDGPIYIRIGRDSEYNVYENNDYEYVIGKAITAREGTDAAFIATGISVGFAFEAARRLALEGINVKVVDMHTIKPIDREAIVEAAKTGLIVTAEDHNVTGGLGSMVAEVLGEEMVSCRLVKTGIPDQWGANGKTKDLYKMYGMDADGLYNTMKKALGK